VSNVLNRKSRVKQSSTTTNVTDCNIKVKPNSSTKDDESCAEACLTPVVSGSVEVCSFMSSQALSSAAEALELVSEFVATEDIVMRRENAQPSMLSY